MKSFLALVLLSVVLVVVKAQFFECTSNAQFTASFDGSQGTATCSSGSNLSGRCAGCCEAWALSRGVPKDQVTGFTSSDASRCTCCGNIRSNNPQLVGGK